MQFKKILFVSKDANWQRYRNEVLNELTSEYKCQVDVITTSGIKNHIKSSERLRYIEVTDIFSWYGKINLLPFVFYYILAKKPDAVLALPNASNITELLLSYFCKLTKTKLIYWTHGYDHCRRPEKGISGFINKVRVKIINHCLSFADSIIAFSPSGKEYLVKEGLAKNKIFIAPNTLNTRKLQANFENTDDNEVEKFKNENNLNNKTIFLFSGRLRSGKRLENFINAATLVSNKNEIALIVVGAGEMQSNWEELCERFGIHAVFLGEVFEDKYLSVIFKASDWFVMPGYVGLAIVHAFSYGLPLLTENISFHSPEIYYLSNGNNGRIFEEGNSQEWVNFIENESQDIDYQKKLSINAINTVKESASIEMQLSGISSALGLVKRV